MAAAAMLTTDELVAKLQLLPHPEGGFFKETFRDDSVHLSKDQLPDGCEWKHEAGTKNQLRLPASRLPLPCCTAMYASYPVLRVDPGVAPWETAL